MTGRNGHHLDTILEHTGRDPAKNFGIVNRCGILILGRPATSAAKG